jgi:hypothetical protein
MYIEDYFDASPPGESFTSDETRTLKVQHLHDHALRVIIRGRDHALT